MRWILCLILLPELCVAQSVQMSRRAALIAAQAVPAAAGGGGGTMPSVTSGWSNTVSGASGSFSKSIDAGANLLIVTANNFNGFIATLTWNGVSMTRLAGTNSTDSLSQAEVWYLATPATGSQTLAYTSTNAAGASANVFPVFVGLGVTGANASPFDSHITLDWTSTSRTGATNSVTSATGELAMGFVFGDFTDDSVTNTVSGAGLSYAFSSPGPGTSDITTITNAGAASVTFGYSSHDDVQSLIIISVKP